MDNQQIALIYLMENIQKLLSKQKYVTYSLRNDESRRQNTFAWQTKNDPENSSTHNIDQIPQVRRREQLLMKFNRIRKNDYEDRVFVSGTGMQIPGQLFQINPLTQTAWVIRIKQVLHGALKEEQFKSFNKESFSPNGRIRTFPIVTMRIHREIEISRTNKYSIIWKHPT